MSDYDFENWAGEKLLGIQSGIDLRRPSNHQSMFKYVSLDSETSWDHLKNTIQNFELVGSSPLDLNDPFELSPFVFDDLQPNSIANSVKYNTLADRLAGKLVKTSEEAFPDPTPYRKHAEAYLKDIEARYRIVAFCERSDSALLWSHYANSYRGACLHFLANGFNRAALHTLGYVSYSKYRPTYPLSLALALSPQMSGPPIPHNATTLKRNESEKLLFFTKADDWSYESEIRLVYDSKKMDAAKFHPDGLVSVVTGPRFSTDDRERLNSLLKNSRYEKLSVRQARLSKTTFSVEID
jgi:hypothetical protein